MTNAHIVTDSSTIFLFPSHDILPWEEETKKQRKEKDFKVLLAKVDHIKLHQKGKKQLLKQALNSVLINTPSAIPKNYCFTDHGGILNFTIAPA